MPDEQVLTKLVGSVYEAATDSAHWPIFLAEFAKAAGADAAASVFHLWDRKVHTVRSSWNFDPNADRLYEQHYGSLDVWAIRGRWKPAGYKCTSEALCPLSELTTTEIYNDYLIQYGFVHGMFGVVENSDARWASVSLFKSPASGEFKLSDLEVLDALVPHLQRAFKLHFQLAELRARSEGVEASLNMLSVGVVFLGASGEVLLMNRVAEEVFQRRDGLLVTRGEIGACLPSESTRLRAMTFGAAQTGSGRGLCAGGTMLISRDKQRPLSLTVAPLREFDPSLPQSPAAVIFISDPDRSAELPADLLSRSYGLTPAEARLATILLEGRSLKEAADLSGVTHNTAKSQLKSVFSKTQVQRQGQLIKLLLNSAGVVNPLKRAG